jgi:hypothetical protein
MTPERMTLKCGGIYRTVIIYLRRMYRSLLVDRIVELLYFTLPKCRYTQEKKAEADF